MPRTAVALVASAGLVLAAMPAQADTLIENVNGLTLDARGEVIRFSGMVIGNDGKVARLIPMKGSQPDPTEAKPRKTDR